MDVDPRLKARDLLAKKYADRDTTNFSLDDFVYAFGSPLDAFMYHALLWPTFVEFEGMVFHPSVIEDDTDRARILHSLEQEHGDRSSVEASFNVFEQGLFGANINDAPDDLLEALQNMIIDMWRAKLSLQFPQRRFEFHIAEESDGFWGFWFQTASN